MLLPSPPWHAAHVATRVEPLEASPGAYTSGIAISSAAKVAIEIVVNNIKIFFIDKSTNIKKVYYKQRLI